ncbi:MAG: hypothetical protein LBK26_02540 [Rickettsiales bacterium]|jgi:hypothetical protein|nr:hypothetical protein [Rickettsiales bacterium]
MNSDKKKTYASAAGLIKPAAYNKILYDQTTQELMVQSERMVPDFAQTSVSLPILIYKMRNLVCDENVRSKIFGSKSFFGFASDVPTAGLCMSFNFVIFWLTGNYRVWRPIILEESRKYNWDMGRHVALESTTIKDENGDDEILDTTKDQFPKNLAIPWQHAVQTDFDYCMNDGYNLAELIDPKLALQIRRNIDMAAGGRY